MNTSGLATIWWDTGPERPRRDGSMVTRKFFLSQFWRMVKPLVTTSPGTVPTNTMRSVSSSMS